MARIRRARRGLADFASFDPARGPKHSASRARWMAWQARHRKRLRTVSRLHFPLEQMTGCSFQSRLASHWAAASIAREPENYGRRTGSGGARMQEAIGEFASLAAKERHSSALHSRSHHSTDAELRDPRRVRTLSHRVRRKIAFSAGDPASSGNKLPAPMRKYVASVNLSGVGRRHQDAAIAAAALDGCMPVCGGSRAATSDA